MSRHWLPPVLLAVYALAFGSRALAGGLLVFDDHPGQLYRLAHALTIGLAPWRLNPGWWAGYAELQYYPPGFSYCGALLHYASLGRLDPQMTYRLLLWIAYVLPAATTYLLLRRVLGSGWLALPGAFLALTLSAGSRSGVEEGLRWGLVAARLGLGLLPLLALALVPWVEGRRRVPLLAAPLFAAVILTHPAHSPAAAVFVLLAARRAPGPRLTRLWNGTVLLLAGVGLAGFWLLPLLAHLSMALPLAWGEGSVLALARQVWERPLLLLLIAANAPGWWRAGRDPGTSTAGRWLVGVPLIVAELVVFDAAFAEPLGIAWLPADRLMDSLLLALILGASVQLSALKAALPSLPSPLVAGTAVAASILLSWSGASEPTLTLWPEPGQWPKSREVARGLRLDDLWSVLRKAPPGRILFIRSAVLLAYHPEWWRPHSHITALTPLETGRGIVNGTFTHPSPVAGLLYTGSAVNRPITVLAERRDGVTLFGRALEELSVEEFNRFADALRISAVVTLDEDQGRVVFLSGNQSFTQHEVIGFFRIFATRDPRALPESSGPQSWRIALASHPGGWLKSGMAWSPLWRASVAGRAVAVRRDDLGMLEVEAPAGTPLVITLEHRPATAELAGLAVSGAAGVALLVGWRRRRAGP